MTNHLFDLTGIILFLPESIFDFVFDFTGDGTDFLTDSLADILDDILDESVAGEAGWISQVSNGKHPVLIANWSFLKGLAITVYSLPFLLISSNIIFRGSKYSLSSINCVVDTILIKGNPSSRYII